MGKEKLCDLVHHGAQEVLYIAARRRAPNRTFLDKLMFSELDYDCVHGGREYKSKATQSRPCQK